MVTLSSVRRDKRFDKRAERASWLQTTCLFALLVLLLAPCLLHAQDSLSAPISASLSDPVYSENDLTGPSSSLFQGSNTLLSPFLRTGISDPLDFLIESSVLSPYDLGATLVGGYVVDPYVNSQVIADTTVAARFSEYQDNRYLMSGAVGRGSLTGRAAAAGGLSAGNKGTTMTSAAAGAFGALTVRAPFAAGSSLLAGRQAAFAGPSTFADPNLLVSALTSPTLNSMQSNTAAGSMDPSSALSDAMGGSSDQFGTTAGVSYAMFASLPAGLLVPAPNSTAFGPAPGSIFPDVTVAMPTMNGFEDSTRGTAGLPSEVQETPTSPLASSHFDSSGPFREASAEGTSYLNPSLIVAADAGESASGRPTLSMSEMTRKARMRSMIYNPTGSPLPSPFEQRAMQREFLRKKSQSRISHYPGLTAPSVTSVK